MQSGVFWKRMLTNLGPLLGKKQSPQAWALQLQRLLLLTLLPCRPEPAHASVTMADQSLYIVFLTRVVTVKQVCFMDTRQQAIKQHKRH